MTKPLIGINADYRAAKQDVPAYSYVAEGYYGAILKAGGLPVIIPPYESEQNVHDVLDQLDGVLLVGGADRILVVTAGCSTPP